MSTPPNSTINFYYQDGMEVIDLTSDVQHDQPQASSRAMRKRDWLNLIDLTSSTNETWLSSDCRIITQPGIFTDLTKDEPCVHTSEPFWGGIEAIPVSKEAVIDTNKNVQQASIVHSLDLEVQSTALIPIASTRSPVNSTEQFPPLLVTPVVITPEPSMPRLASRRIVGNDQHELTPCPPPNRHKVWKTGASSRTCRLPRRFIRALRTLNKPTEMLEKDERALVIFEQSG